MLILNEHIKYNVWTAIVHTNTAVHLTCPAQDELFPLVTRCGLWLRGHVWSRKTGEVQPDSKRLNSDCQWRMTASIFNHLFSFKSTCQRTRPPHLYPAMGPQWLGGTLSWVGWLFIMMCSRSFCLTRGLATAPAGEEIRRWFASYAVTKWAREPGWRQLIIMIN